MEKLTVKLKTIDGKVKFSAAARENPEVVIDYFAPLGTGNGYTSLELLMASFGTCVGTVLLSLFRNKMKKTIESMSAEVYGEQRNTHPKSLETMSLLIKIVSNDLTKTEAEETLKIAEDKLCPVWAMIKGNVTIHTEIEIIRK